MEAVGSTHTNQAYDHDGQDSGPNTDHSAQHKAYDADRNRAEVEKLSKKKGFTLTQKAACVGIGTTGLLFMSKSKILKFFSFLTAIPTIGASYFAFFRKKAPATQKAD